MVGGFMLDKHETRGYDPASAHEQRYLIGVVALRMGLTLPVIGVWEKRNGAAPLTRTSPIDVYAPTVTSTARSCCIVPYSRGAASVKYAHLPNQRLQALVAADIPMGYVFLLEGASDAHTT